MKISQYSLLTLRQLQCKLPVALMATLGFALTPLLSRSPSAFSSARSSWVSSAPSSHAPAARPSHRAAIVAADKSLGLPAELGKLVDRFAAVPDAKLRYQQLLFYAKNLPPMDASLKTEENRVRGCTSVVHVHVVVDDEQSVKIEADSDAQLTKGLVALLVNGLSGCTLEEVLAVDPAFIVASGLSVSLTPSRNNGFVNMVAKIKEKLVALRDGASVDEATENEGEASSNEEIADRPMYTSMLRKMRALQPTELDIKDDSHLHRGHRGMDGRSSEESHFRLHIVADAFDGMSLVKRHRLVFTMLAEEMEHIHALNIEAWTTAEAADKSAKKAAAKAARE